MFYAHIILAKKGPLARIWLAAHWDKKITKAHVFETNIEKSVEGIMQPKVKLALRTSGHLLLGVVRIYSRKAKYLLADCNEAFVKIKMAFRPGMVDLPEGHREANVNAITLPEVFHDFDTALPELNDIDLEAQFSINQSKADEITMREDYGSLSMSLHDDGFGDIGFENDTPDLMRGPMSSNLNDQLFEDDVMGNVAEANAASITLNEADLAEPRLDGDGFGDEFGQPELFEDDLFGETTLTNIDKEAPLQPPAANESDDDGGMHHFADGGMSPASSPPNSPRSVTAKDAIGENLDAEVGEAQGDDKAEENLDQTTLIQNEDEGFALAPVDAAAYKGVTKTKRKRKLIVDECKNISGEEMKAQLANTSDIVTTLDLAPPTKRWLMYWKETGGVEKLFSLPSRTIPARVLLVNYNRHLVSHFTQLEDFSCLGPSDLLALDHIQPENESPTIINSKRGRKRKADGLAPTQHISGGELGLGDTTTQSLALPEQVRDQERSAATSHEQESLIPGGDGIFDSMRSPEPLFDMHPMDHLSSLNDMNMTPRNIGHGLDNSDDFNQGDLTPAGLHHGQLSPHHTGLESIQSIPNLPADQISSILHEAENMGTSGNMSNRPCEIASDWNDYDFPTSIVQNTTDDQMLENETTEQFEERVLNKRAAQLFFAVKCRMAKQDSLMLSDFTVRNSRKQAAQKFYSLLVLKKFRALNMSQTAPYMDIVVTRGPLFENPKL